MSVDHRIVAVVTGLGLVALGPFVPTPARVVGAAAFLLVAPGLAWVHTLPVTRPVERLAVAVALSLAVDVLVAEALMFAGMPGPLPSAAVLVGVAVLGVAMGRQTRVEVPA